MRCGREGMRASGERRRRGGWWWEMDRWEIKAAAGSSQEEREEWRRDNWKRKDGARARLHPEGKRSGVEGCKRGAGRVGVGVGRRDRSASVKDGTPKQVSVRQRVRQTEYIKSGGRPGGRLAGVMCTFGRQRQGQRTPSARRLVCPQLHQSALAFFRLARGSCAFDHLMMLLHPNCFQDWFIAKGGDSPFKHQKKSFQTSNPLIPFFQLHKTIRT